MTPLNRSLKPTLYPMAIWPLHLPLPLHLTKEIQKERRKDVYLAQARSLLLLCGSSKWNWMRSNFSSDDCAKKVLQTIKWSVIALLIKPPLFSTLPASPRPLSPKLQSIKLTNKGEKEMSPYLSSWRKVYSVSNWLRKRQWILFWRLSVFLIFSKSLSFRSLACVETCSEREVNSREILCSCCITIPNG